LCTALRLTASSFQVLDILGPTFGLRVFVLLNFLFHLFEVLDTFFYLASLILLLFFLEVKFVAIVLVLVGLFFLRGH
jgi:hypothetical protein